MKRSLLLAVLLIPFIAQSQATKQSAKTFIEAIFNQQYDTAISYIDSSVQSKVTPAILGQMDNYR